MKHFSKIQSASSELSRLQDNVAASLQSIQSNPLLSGHVLANVTLTAGENLVPHKLGRTLSGWFCTRMRGEATIYDGQDDNQNPQLLLALTSSDEVEIDLFVF